MSCILALFAGCGTSESGTVESPDAASFSGTEQGDAGNADPGHITVAQVKSAVLENAGLVEEDVRFVRIHMDSENGAFEYDVEFICQDAEYDYKVSAVTGEILSMDYEVGKYDLDALPTDITQSQAALPDASQDPGASPDASQSSDASSDASQGPGTPSDAAQILATPQNPGAMPEADGQYIGNEAAKQIALEHAGLTEDGVRFLHARLERDDNSWKYDVEFLKDSIEYDYDIDALTGEILSFDQDVEDDQHGAGSSTGNVQITEDQAKQIALEYAGVDERNAQHLKIELDYDHGRGEYEVEWYVGRTEYSCDVDADTGSILSFEKELD